jgi:hypothetical protein
MKRPKLEQRRPVDLAWRSINEMTSEDVQVVLWAVQMLLLSGYSGQAVEEIGLILTESLTRRPAVDDRPKIQLHSQ